MNRFNLCVGGGASRSLKAFTLAEVLITLAIIGVVAALTIPSVITNYRNQEIETRLKKTFSILNAAAQMAFKDHGSMVGWDIANPPFTREHAQDFVDKYMAPYLRIAKNCGISTTDDCSYDSVCLNNTPSSTFSFRDPYSSRFYLSDGTLLSVQIGNEDDYPQDRYAAILFDINGHKKPNIVGKDIFYFRYQLIKKGLPDGSVRPVGSSKQANNFAREGNSGYCNTKSWGTFCARAIMNNNWKIPTKEQFVDLGGNPEHYPW